MAFEVHRPNSILPTLWKMLLPIDCRLLSGKRLVKTHVHHHGQITDMKKNQNEMTKKNAEGSQSHDSGDLKAEELDSLSFDDHVCLIFS